MIASRNVVAFALAGLVMLLAGYVPLPGIDLEMVAGQNYYSFGDAMGRHSVFALGLQPIYIALMLAEIGKLFIPPQDRDPQKPAAPGIMLVRLLALAIAASQAYGVAVAHESAGLVQPDFDLFVPLTIASCVAATALAMFLIDRVRLDGFANGFWALHAVLFASALVADAGNDVDLLRVGAISFQSVPVGLACSALGVAAILFVTSLWHGLAAGGAGDGKEAPLLPRDILIWPVALSFFVAQTLFGGLAYEIARFMPALAAGSPIFVLTIFAMLLIPCFVFGYARRSRAQVGSTARLALVASLIAVVQIALVALSAVPYLLPARMFLPEHFHLIALTLTAVGIGALKIPAFNPEERGLSALEASR